MTSTVVVHWDVAAKLNFACHQSSFPVLRSLRIENRNQDERLQDVTVSIRADPAFMRPKIWNIGSIAPDGTIEVRDRDILLEAGFLRGLADAVKGSMTLVVEHHSAAPAEEVKPIEVLAYNEWGGAGYMPELLAAFSIPNDPAIDRILHAASVQLRSAGRPDAIDGYRSGSRERVWEIASAIYAAITNLGISYVGPPASFESDGQKIRLPGQIEASKVATCLDTTMLFAAAFEQAGLNPVIALPRGHALVGVWLQPEELSSIVIEDAETLRKRCGLNELMLIETTLVTANAPPMMTQALERAKDSLDPDRDTTFCAAVDIRRARAHQIRPLGLNIADSGAGVAIETTPAKISMESAPPLPDFDSEVEEEPPQTPEERLDRWQRKLLDLSLRNPLLNHTSKAASLPILCPDPAALEDRLAEGAKISIKPVPQPTAEAQDQEIHTTRTGRIIITEYAQEALANNQVLVDLSANDLATRSVKIYRNAQTSLQEGGANTLYLAIGFLSWKRERKDDRRFRAPLILVPVALHRQSVKSGIKMSAHDEEPRFNTTLLQMLRKDFLIEIPNLDGQLPQDSAGIDVTLIWNQIRRAVKDVPGFEVSEDVVLGHFSFAKYLMWKDLADRTDELKKSPLVRHLIDTPHDAYANGGGFVSPRHLDRKFAPADLLAPLEADSSQMTVIATAEKKRDFIIIGPPGTGKSQTISNLIAHFLGKGKTVLFVSEKTAALNVVHRRLTEIGLGKFCLELHSNKANKAKVLRQLARAWEAGGHRTPEGWSAESDRLQKLRDRLNKVVDYLHTRRRNGLTPYHAIGVQVRDAELARRVTLSWPRADHHDEMQLDAMREAVHMLRVQAEAIGSIADNPLRIVENPAWSPRWQDDLVARCTTLASAAGPVDKAAESLADTLGVGLPDRTMSRLGALADLAGVLRESYRQQTEFALEADGPDRIEALDDAISRLRAYAAARESLSTPYGPRAWEQVDGEDIRRRWQAAKKTWWPRRFFLKSSVIRDLRAAGANGKPNPEQDAPVLAALRREGEAINRLGGLLSGLRIWQGLETDSMAAETLLDLGRRARSAAGSLADNPQMLVEIRSGVRKLLTDGNDLLAAEATVGIEINSFLTAFSALSASVQAADDHAGGDILEACAEDGRDPEGLRKVADMIVARRGELQKWCNWRRRRQKAIDLDLVQLVKGLEDGRVPAAETEETFEAAYCAWWSKRLFEEDEILRHWSTAEHQDAIRKFRKIDNDFRKTTADLIAAQLSSAIPEQSAPGNSSQWGVVRKLAQQSQPHVPIRQLIADVPEPISTLTPCLMMSPLSIAQYLSPAQPLFDLVIFDEASQLTVWDAVGAIARGRQVIVAGDPKQMPPTNFFARADDDPDGEISYEGDEESILDELRSSGVPERTLNLHYRSRRESLIAFSNSHYYGNSLVTFPAPVHPDHAVRLIKPDGFYARGGARHNQGEATAVVGEVVRRLTSDDPEIRGSSIGVVTFNSEQQSLILDLLDKARSSNPEIEWAFSEDTPDETVFVKNLETVQGDERDVILFSVGYGPAQNGRVTMNFGPLNRQGGERRLNVALTRSRNEMIVFSTLEHDQIDLGRTNAKAVKHLKHFLEYAACGPSVLGLQEQGSVGDFESPFEIAVAQALRDKGWTLHPQIGVSKFRIDIGIVHPDRPSAYLAGVECDGAMYHSSAYARERDKIRQSVLEQLGWTLFRVWSTDWWLNRGQALGSLVEQLDAHLEADRLQRRATAPATVQPDALGSPDGDTEASVIRPPSAGIVVEENPLSAPVGAGGHAAPDTRYVRACLDKDEFPPDQESFYDESYAPHLTKMIKYVIDTEGPIHEGLLARRISRHHRFQRSGRRIQKLVSRLARQCRPHTEEEVGRFFWHRDEGGDETARARSSNRDDETRRLNYICAGELRDIANDRCIRDAAGLARVLGTSRLTKAARARLEQILETDA